MATDFSKLSDDDLLSQLPARRGATPAPAVGAVVGQAPAAPAPAADFTRMSDDDLLAALPQRQPQRSAGEEVGRQVGLTARAGVQGVLGLPGMVSDAATGLVNTGLDAALGQGNGFRFQRVGAAADNLMTKAGLPQPENATERVVQDATAGMAGGATSALLARGGAALARTAGNKVAEGVADGLAAAPGMQAVSGATSAGAAGTVRENGGGAGAQLAAGLTGALVPGAAAYATQGATRLALRGGEAGRQQVADSIRTFEDAAGVHPTMGQATGSRTWQAAETGLSNVIGGSGVMVRKGEEQANALQRAVYELAYELAPQSSGANAGVAITKGVNAFKDSVKTTQHELYGRLDQFIPAATPVRVGRTQEALAALNEGIPGAPNISSFFRNSKLSSIEQALLKDLDAAAEAQVAPGMRGMGTAREAGQLPYEAVQKLRSMVGREMADNSLVADVPRSKWRALYTALTEDLGDAAAQAGPQAQQAWNRANTYTRASIERLEQLESIVNKDAPEKIFRAATSGMGEGGTTIARVMKSMPLENRREITAAVLQRLGRARPGQQNEMGDAFSSETFLTNLAAMSPEARRSLFGSSGFAGLEDRITEMGRMAATRREGAQVFANPSGTARQTALLGWGAALMSALASGNPVAIGGALAAPVGANLAAKAATSRRVVDFAAQRTELSRAAVPAVVTSLAQRAQEQAQAERPKGPIGRSLAQLALGTGAAAMLPVAPALSMSLAERALRQQGGSPTPVGGPLAAQAYMGR